MNPPKQKQTRKQYPSVKRAWEARAARPVIAVRLSPEGRDRLTRLAAKFGGNREAIEAGLVALDATP